jgi:hypothetical protein
MTISREGLVLSCRPIFRRLLPAAAAAALLAAACNSTIATLSPDNLGVEITSDLPVYAPRGNFAGTFTFVSKSGQRMKVRFPTTGLYHVDFYDVDGNLRRSYFTGQDSVVTYLELAPFGTRTDSLKFPLYSPSESLLAGPVRVRAWVDGYEGIYSETAIEVR